MFLGKGKTMRRREKSFLTSILLSFGLVLLQLVPLEWRPLGLVAFAVLAYLVTAWTLFDNLDGVEWLTIVPLPALYSLAVSSFYFLLPESLIARVAILGVFGLGMYALLLAGNIFSIAKTRTIQLLRAAQAVLFFFCLIAALLLFNTLFSLGLWFVWNGIAALLVGIFFSFSFYWSIRLEQRLSREVLALTARTGLTMSFLAMILSFLPGSLWPTSLLLMTALYVLLGMGQSALEQRLFTNTVREYVGVLGSVVFMYFVFFTWK
jgi:hypothetical protein